MLGDNSISDLEKCLYKTAQNLQCVSQRILSQFQKNNSDNSPVINLLNLLERIHKIQAQCDELSKAFEFMNKWRQHVEPLVQQLIDEHNRLCEFRKLIGLGDLEHDPKENLRTTLALLQSLDGQKTDVQLCQSVTCKQTNSFGSSCESKNSSQNNTKLVKNVKMKPQIKEITKTENSIKRTETKFVPITEEEFLSVSDTVRGRCKLDDLNSIWNVLFEHHVSKKTLKISELAAMGYKKLVGQTGKAILKTLQHLKLVHVSKEGEISLICFSQ